VHSLDFHPHHIPEHQQINGQDIIAALKQQLLNKHRKLSANSDELVTSAYGATAAHSRTVSSATPENSSPKPAASLSTIKLSI
jgi:hypothetical protein